MSSYDGNRNEGTFCPHHSSDLAQILAQTPATARPQPQQQPPPPPPPQLLFCPGFMQTATHTQQSPPQQQLQQQQQQPQPLQQQQPQQHFNEHYFNMYTSPPGQPETYSVLPVGHGNFLKVYHSTENTQSGLASEGNTLYQALAQTHQPFQPQQSAAYHVPPAQATTTQFYNSYELFSSNTLMPTPDNRVCLGREQQPQPQAPTFPLSSIINNDEQSAAQAASSSTANMIINKLVNNWSPNLTGAPIQQLPAQPAAAVPTNVGTLDSQQCSVVEMSNEVINSIQVAPPTGTAHLPQQLPLAASTKPASVPENSPSNSYLEVGPNSVGLSTPNAGTPCGTNASGTNNSPPGLSVTPPEIKKRIVAEVKPMRMTYSDVLSKMNNQQSVPAQQNNAQNTTGKQNKSSNNAALFGERKGVDNNKCNGDFSNGSNNAGNVRRPAATEEGGAASTQRGSKKSPTHENKENMQQLQANSGQKGNKRIGTNTNGSSNISNGNGNGQLKQTPKTSQKPPTAEANGNPNATASAASINNSSKKRSNNKRNDTDAKTLPGSNSKTQKNAQTPANDKHFNGFYNVAAKEQDSFERSVPKANSNSANAMPNAPSTRKSSNSKSNSSYYGNNSNSIGSNQIRSRYNNGTSNTSYSYSSKRGGRGANFSAYNSSSADSTNRNYELAKKFLRTWLEYTMKILAWLYYLIYDIIVLGFSMVYDRLMHVYELAVVYVKQWRTEWKQNSNKPHVWIKNCWRRFDARFKKNSRWAFWRRFYQKKPPEAAADNFKSGRLPQTGEEAMYSLLNCKGKDAYSILGVPADSSQEQIRKHYKKIAVLVHPDKNKQAGAEEAFKVLQRAFELIGEPEKRLAYDQSLAEAMHTEKAWTELHDLISQLKTKLTEAANTIKCSTCGLRHPRRLTDRPHYAARQCASCKIRHSAREGDIWAETSLLGLRWKYLALMEGKVYDITEWANCQKGALSHLEPNSHMVQYRIVRGAQQQQQQQQAQQQTHQHHSPHHQSRQQYAQHTGTQHERSGSGKFKRNIPPSEASLHEFLDNLYSGQNPNQTNPPAYSNSTRRRARRN